MITKAIQNAFKKAKQRGWDKTYWAFDIHETIIEPNWDEHHIPTKFYPLAKKALQMISKRKDVTMLLYTCSHPHEIEKYLEYFKQHNIHFEYVNKNPEVINKKYGYYSDKPYFNVLFEDKAGFDAQEDWEKVIALIKTI